MNIDSFRPATIYIIYIAATPEQVWQALTTAEFSRKYFFGFAVETELWVGGPFTIRTPDGSVHIDGQVMAGGASAPKIGEQSTQIQGEFGL